MKITLDSNPSDAPCCVKLIAEDGRDLTYVGQALGDG
jgi:hypothetical protein